MGTVRNFLIVCVATAAAVALVSCSEDGLALNNDDVEVITLSIEQPVAEVTKTSLGSKTGDRYPVFWTADDAIAVSLKTGDSCQKYTLQSGENTLSGTFSGVSVGEGSVYAYYPYDNVISVSGSSYSVTIPGEQKYRENSFGIGTMPMYGSADDAQSLHSMVPLLSVLKLTLQGTDVSVRDIVVASESNNLSGTATVNMATGEVSFTSGMKNVTLSCETAQDITEAKTFHIVVPAVSAGKYVITIFDDKGRLLQKTFKTTAGFEAGTIKKAPAISDAALDYFIPGKFTVSSYQEAQFTTGNLWYGTKTLSGETVPLGWHLEPNQTDCISTWDETHVGHLFWVSSNVYSKGYEDCMPYASTYKASALSTGDDIFCGIIDVEDITVTLNALTANGKGYQWDYLLKTRKVGGKTGNGYSFTNYMSSGFTLGDVTFKGLAIYPDGFSGEKDMTKYSSFSSIAASGIVLLPATGYREGTEIKYLSSDGWYWSCSAYGSDVNSAYNLTFSASSCNVYAQPREYGKAIRLVCVTKK